METEPGKGEVRAANQGVRSGTLNVVHLSVQQVVLDRADLRLAPDPVGAALSLGALRELPSGRETRFRQPEGSCRPFVPRKGTQVLGRAVEETHPLDAFQFLP